MYFGSYLKALKKKMFKVINDISISLFFKSSDFDVSNKKTKIK
jgi:hypothetical protein